MSVRRKGNGNATNFAELFQSRKGKGIESDYILTMVFALSPWSIRGGLQSWVKSDLWGCVVKEAGKVPEEAEFNISLHEALDELELSGAVVGTGFPKSIDMHNPPSLVKRERIKPRTIQRW